MKMSDNNIIPAEQRASQATGESRDGAAPDVPVAGAGSFATASEQEEALPPTTEGDLVAEGSMAEPVTRHALIPHLENFQYLLCGFDSLDIGLFVE
ncbi:hypothetical protein L4X63_11920 [Geomonas sp. Red32]|uniref:hypothetical protein n=1 Tax=Geomonas sp. Red32 TaxID=2912856 RepID=UPI00202D011A|nr:hypothetical protein [Geomonas sp. Red32]MCM0082297.1 hypothetical protein [Geomonas sp. Red32]